MTEIESVGNAAGPSDARWLVSLENHARTAALRVLGWVREGESAGKARRAIVLAGRSQAGAAALAVARHLANYGVGTRTVVCGPDHRLSPVTLRQREILVEMGVRFDELLAVDEVRWLVEAADEDAALVEGAGDDPSPGREKEFAACARGETGAGLRIGLAPAADYRPPAPSREDAVFTPEATARSREAVRLMDSTAIERYRIPGLVLMENAGWRAARETFAALDFEPSDKRALVLAGPGNNGGDGFVAARHLAGWGVAVDVALAGPRERVLDDALANLELLEEDGVSVRVAEFEEPVEKLLGDLLPGAAVVVDALLGTGLSGKVRGPIARAIDIVNESGARVVAVDIPSGLDANTGEVLGSATTAERTVTFGFPKTGFALGEGPSRVGDLVVADISLPRALWARSE